MQRPSRKGVGPSGPKRAALYGAVIWSGLHGNMQMPKGWRGLATPVEHNDGVTKRGIRTQLIQDGHVPGEGKAVGENADYMRDQLTAALDETIAGARKIMSWMQSCAEVLTDVGLPLTWTTPSGSRVCQSYNVPTQSAVKTLLGRVQIDKSEMGSQLAKRKQMLGAAPNIVHSFDAAHLALTVNQCVAEGVVDLAMIHDSFATHAGSTDRLGMILRETFAAIYVEDWLAKLYLEFQGAAPAAEMPVPPETGDFDVVEVVRAPFFFS